MTKWIHGALILPMALLVGGVGTQMLSGQAAARNQDGQPADQAVQRADRTAQNANQAKQARDREKMRSDRRMIVDLEGGRIGASLRDVERADAEQAKLPESTGAYVREVDPGSPAEKAGLKAGDVVVEFDGERVRGARQLIRLVRETPDGRSVKATVVRAGARQTLTVTPERRNAWTDQDMQDVMARVDRSLRNLPRHFEFDLPDPPTPPRPPAAPRLDGRRGGGARLGVAVQPLSDQLAAHFGAKNGVLVSEVEEGSPAAKAGLQAGDVITTVDGRPLDDPGDLARDVRRAEGKDLSIGVMRDRKALTLKATVVK